MGRISISRTLVGGLLLLFGVIWGYDSFLPGTNFWGSLLFGIALIILGIFILFNAKEDQIEQIKEKDLKIKSSKKKK